LEKRNSYLVARAEEIEISQNRFFAQLRGSLLRSFGSFMLRSSMCRTLIMILPQGTADHQKIPILRGVSALVMSASSWSNEPWGIQPMINS
jgi:hypothetical protein